MRVYKFSIIITSLISITTLILAAIFNTFQFANGVLLGVFGSSMVAVITSIIGYFVERKKLMITLLMDANQYIKLIWDYDTVIGNEEKFEYYNRLYDYDFSKINSTVFEMCFFDNKMLTFIRNKLYLPMFQYHSSITEKMPLYRALGQDKEKNAEKLGEINKELSAEGKEVFSIVKNVLWKEYREKIYGKRRMKRITLEEQQSN